MADGETGTETGAETCAKCGGADVTAGHIVWNAPVRFKADGASQFRRGVTVRALACQACGHIELALAER